MESLTKITEANNFSRYHISFSHAIIFVFSIQGTSALKNRKINQK
ncbi:MULTISPECIES: hypothetical protein [Enterococcus]|uniref:Uncharacterized protein n=1 Tax=Candidatus Enterococcus mangumiae TaxID=2230878 RepID=A0ABZ2T3X5_9ENTE|nr:MULTISPECIES: hypothetical protein [unclassified Enterococcus]